MQPQKQQELTPEFVNNLLTSWKKQDSQVEGEITTMRQDKTSSIFSNFGRLIGELLNLKTKAETDLKASQETLNKIYQGHPDIRISMEADAKAEAQKKNPQNKTKKK